MTQPAQLATTVSNLVVTPQVSAVSVTCTTTTAAVRGQLQIGTASGTYTTFTSGRESVPATTHSLVGYGLAAATLYHYIIQWYDGFGNALDATADATFTTLTAPVGGSGAGSIIGPLYFGAGVPASSLGTDGSYYFRSDGTTGAFIYHRAAGAWTAVI
jgi:hypothetical protein